MLDRLVGQPIGDGLDGVGDVLAAAEVAGPYCQVLQDGDAVLRPDAPRGENLAPAQPDKSIFT
ncbi:hypothetical protein ACFVYE_40920 [Streptomyces sp. NPDC058239]|uniref:hypothetical protein n=1 Tax=unclassified Streptomyces TaxID=2593676 RepID=UPI0036552FD6